MSVKKNPSYSPGDLHKHVFWVLTGGGVLDLFAYNEDAYKMWLDNVGSVASMNAKRGIENLNVKKQSKTNSRPSSSHGRYSRATIAPVNDVTNEAITSSLHFGSNMNHGDDSVASSKVNTGTNSGATSHDLASGGIDANSKFSIFNRSLSVPVHLLPLTTSTPQESHADHRVTAGRPSQNRDSRQTHTPPPHLPTVTNSDDVI